MGIRSKALAGEEHLLKKMMLKKLSKLRKMLRSLKMNNSSLKGRNKELVLTVQDLKVSLREAENKLRSMSIALCEVNATKNSYQESFNKLAGQMLELTSVLYGSSSIVTKIYGTITETTLKAGGTVNVPNIHQMAGHSESMKQTSESARELIDRLKEIRTDGSISSNTDNTEDTPSTSATLVPSLTENGNSYTCNAGTSSNMLPSPSESNRKRVNIAENISINPPAQPINYRLPLYRALSPVEELPSQVTNDESERNSNNPPRDSSDITDSLQEDCNVSNCVDESSTISDENDLADPEVEDSIEYYYEPVDEKPIVHEIDQKPSIINLQASFQSSLEVPTKVEALRDGTANGSLTLQEEDPGISEMTTVLRPSSEMEYPIQITIMHQVQNSHVVASPSYSVSSVIVDKSFTCHTPGSKLFQNVFPRRKKALPQKNNENVSSSPATPGKKRKSSELSLLGSPEYSRISLRSHSSRSTRRSSRNQSSPGSPGSPLALRNKESLKASPSGRRSLISPPTSRNKGSLKSSSGNRQSSRTQPSPSNRRTEKNISSPGSRASSRNASSITKRSLESQPSPSVSGQKTGNKQSLFEDTKSPKMTQTPRKNGKLSTSPRVSNGKGTPRGKRTRGVLKSYKEPPLNKKLRR